MNLLASFALAATLAFLPGQTAKEGAHSIPCNQGCNPNGQCWFLLATYEENVAADGDFPLWITHKRYTGNPYPTQFDAECGAIFVKEHGICLGYVSSVVTPSKIETILADGTETPYPAEDECYY